MRTMIIVVLCAVALAPAFGAGTTPAQYATGSQWENSLIAAPEVNVMGATAITSWQGNIYLLQGNLLRKFTPDLKEAASVQLPDLSQVMTSLEASRSVISCGMQGPDASGRMNAAMNQFNTGMPNNWQTTASLQQVSDQNMVQGLHQAHTVNALSQVQIAADQNGVYLLRGGRLTVFDQNLHEVRSQDVMVGTANAADCPLCQAALSNGPMMDQLRFRGMQSGLCPGPGQYNGTVFMGDTSRERMANRQQPACQNCAMVPMTEFSPGTAQAQPVQSVEPVQPVQVVQPVQPVQPATVEVPVSLSTAAPAPTAGTYAGPTSALMAPAAGTNYGMSSAGSPQQWRAMQESMSVPAGAFIPGGPGVTTATTPGTVGAPHGGTAVSVNNVWAEQGGPGTTAGLASRPGTAIATVNTRADQGGPGTTPGTSGTPHGGTAVTAGGTRSTPGVSSGGYMGGTTGGGGGGAGYQPSVPQGGVIIGTGLETVSPGTYGWMYDLAGLDSGQVVPVATRNVINGSVLLGVTGTTAGPQFLHVHVLQPDGQANPDATITAYLYTRGDVDHGRALNLIQHAGGEYMIRFDPTQMHGDTLAVRIMRPQTADQVVFFSLAGSEMSPQ